MINYLNNYFGRSIKRMVMASFVLVLFMPIGFFIYSLFQNSWEQAEQEMLEKHELIATALVEPFSLYILSRQRSLHTVGEELFQIESETKVSSENLDHEIEVQHHNIQKALEKYIKSFDDFISGSYVSRTVYGGKPIHWHLATNKPDSKHLDKPDYSNLSLSSLAPYYTNKVDVDFLSPVFISSISKTPVILLKHSILDANNKVAGNLYVEVSLGYIGSMCSKINFGVKGHCAVVDQTGHVVAHPNKEWVKEIRDLSKVSVVKKMLAGKTGTTEFYSPFLKEDMVAGYSSVPGLGWGVMIPQPKSELTYAFDKLRENTLIWLLLGIIIALFMAFKLTNRITRPINSLMVKTNQFEKDNSEFSLGPVPKNSPLEITQLWHSFSQLLSGLDKSNREVKRLNISLSDDIKQTKEKLSAIQKGFKEINNKDYLTSLYNRSYFASELQSLLNQKSMDSVGIILINVDNFDQLNKKYGFLAGDIALKQTSKVILNTISKDAVAARLHGDEFSIYIKNISDDNLSKVAEKLRENIMFSSIEYEDKSFFVRVSIGTVNKKGNKNLNLEEFLTIAYEALAISKQQGRNKVTAYDFENLKSVSIAARRSDKESDLTSPV